MEGLVPGIESLNRPGGCNRLLRMAREQIGGGFIQKRNMVFRTAKFSWSCADTFHQLRTRKCTFEEAMEKRDYPDGEPEAVKSNPSDESLGHPFLYLAFRVWDLREHSEMF